MNEAQRDRKDHISFRLQTAPELGNRLRSKPGVPMSDVLREGLERHLGSEEAGPSHACDIANTVLSGMGRMRAQAIKNADLDKTNRGQNLASFQNGPNEATCHVRDGLWGSQRLWRVSSSVVA